MIILAQAAVPKNFMSRPEVNVMDAGDQGWGAVSYSSLSIT